MPDRTAAFLHALSAQGGAPTIAPPPTIAAPPPTARPKPAAPPFSLPIEPFDPFDPDAPAQWIEQAGQPARPASSAPAELGHEAVPVVATPVGRDPLLDARPDLIGDPGESSEDDLSPGARLVLLILGLSVGGAVLLLAVQLLG